MNSKLEEINDENNLIFIYFILLMLYLYANNVEIKYLESNNNLYKEEYRILLYIVFGVSFLITLYYVINGFNELDNSKYDEIYSLKFLSNVANLLVLIATGIYLYIIYNDVNIDLEVSL